MKKRAATSSRLNHVKVITPEPAVVDAFLREVCDIPEGWPLGDAQPLAPGTALGPGGSLPDDVLLRRRGPAETRGFVVGDPSSRQYQVVQRERAAHWAVCISTRDLQGIYARCHTRGVPCTSVDVADWTPRDDIRFFFCIVAGLLFEVIRVEPKPGV